MTPREPLIEHELSALDGATEWLNSAPLTSARLRGNAVLVQFWTYSCINWIRTLPYVRAWAERYRDRGLVVVGAHSPEFSFERDLDNVLRAARDMRVDYPIVIDNDYAIWRSFKNRYWPALYLVDGHGNVHYHHFGEGAYEQSETTIQQLLGVVDDLVRVDAGGIEAAADWDTLTTPETYVGYGRSERRISAAPARLTLNQWALSDHWTVQEEAAVLNAAGGGIAYRFHARDLNLVLAPAAPDAAVRFRVLIDGHPPGDAHGIDVDEQGNGAVSEPRLYQLVRQRGAVVERTFEITFLDPGVQAYVFTFG